MSRLVGYTLTSRYGWLPSHCLLDASTEDGKVGQVGDGRGVVTANAVNLILALDLPFGVMDHADQEVVDGSSDSEDTNESHHSDHARRLVIPRDVRLFGSFQVVLGEARPLLTHFHALLGLLEALHEEGLLFVVALALPKLPGVDRFGNPIPERSQDVGDRAGGRHLSEQSPCAGCKRDTERGVVPCQLAHDLGAHVFERKAEIIGVFQEPGHPSLGFKLHDAVVAYIGRTGKVRVSKLSLTSPVFYFGQRRSFKDRRRTYGSFP